MEFKAAFKEQFRAALAMLADCIQRCPEELWTTPNPMIDEGDRVIYRPFWRIAFHAVYFAHLYLGQSESAFEPWPGRQLGTYDDLWATPCTIEPLELPASAEPLSQRETLEYVAWLSEQVDPIVDGLDLATADSGFSWYKKVNKLSHELLNLRHLQGHVGQLSELLMARDIESEWISRA